MEFFRANKFGNDIRREISGIFVDGFFKWLKYFSKDKERLTRAFEHIFQTDAFYVAIENERVLAIAACPQRGRASVKLNKKEFIKHLGFFMGRVAYMVLHKEFEVKQYPLEIPSNMGQIEFVATAAASRGKGVAHRLLEYIFSDTEYSQYVLEVADANENAVRLYERLGFKEIKRVAQKNAKRAGFHYLLYMRLDK